VNRTDHGLSIAATVVGVIALLLVGLNALMQLDNQTVQGEIQQRQAFINQSLQLARVSEALVRALAQASVVNQDAQVRDLLAHLGISVIARDNPPSATTPAGK
jgi:hypothetical protein